jgi:acyl-CoA reductase-like NAD-dependent aldehyde dehydrogenase
LSLVVDLLRSIDDALVTEDGRGIKNVIAGMSRDQGRKVWVETPLGHRYYVVVTQDLEAAFDLRYDALSLMSPSDRLEVLAEASDTIDDYKDVIAKIISAETGKRLPDAREEVEASQSFISQAQELLSSRGTTTTGRPHFDLSGEWTSAQVIVREGVGLVLPPFTSPFFGSIAGASTLLANGMPAVVKPPWQASASVAAALSALRETDLGDFLSMINTSSYGTLPAEEVASVVLFGREFTYRSLRRSFSNVIANCSGRAALLLCAEPKDVEGLAKKVVESAVSNAGQACGSVRWVLALRGLGEDLVESMQDYISQLSVGDPLEGKDVGPLRTRGLVDRAAKLVSDATSRGARALGEARAEGNYMSPVVLSEVPRGAEILWGDVEAPIISVSLYDDCSEVVQTVSMLNSATSVIVYGGLSTAYSVAKSRTGAVVWGRDDSFELLKAMCHVVGDPARYFSEGPELPASRRALLLF